MLGLLRYRLPDLQRGLNPAACVLVRRLNMKTGRSSNRLAKLDTAKVKNPTLESMRLELRSRFDSLLLDDDAQGVKVGIPLEMYKTCSDSLGPGLHRVICGQWSSKTILWDAVFWLFFQEEEQANMLTL